MLYNIYFSPTGGTKRAADCVAQAICDDCVTVDLIKNPNPELRLSQKDLCLIAAPSFGGRVPAVCADLFSKISGNGAKCVLLVVFGNRAVDDALAELSDIAEKGGFIVIAAIEAVAEHSLARIYANGRPDTADAEELTAFGKKIKSKFLSGDISAIAVPGARPYKQAGTRPMDLVLRDTCIGCKTCVRECPVGAISPENVSVYDKEKCFSCLHCVSVCPMKARQNSSETTKMFEERLRERCTERKQNKLYI